MTAPSSSFETAGERLCGRKLEKQEIGGITHYKAGQHHAEVISDDGIMSFKLTWVNEMGYAVLLPVKRIGGEWIPFPMYRVAGQETSPPPYPIESDYTFSLSQLRVLNTALAEG